MVAGCDQLFNSHKSNSRLILIKWLSLTDWNYTLIRTSEFCSGQVLFFPYKNIISTQNIFLFLLCTAQRLSCPHLALIQDSPKGFNCCLSLSLFSFIISEMKWKWTDRARQCCWWKCCGVTNPTKWCLETGGIHTCQENAEGSRINNSLKTVKFKKLEYCYNWSLEEFKYVPTLSVTKAKKGNAQRITLLTNTMTRSFFSFSATYLYCM